MTATNGRGLSIDAIFHFRICCADCGAVLALKGGMQIEPDVNRRLERNQSGGDMTVAVAPCADCMERELGPARAIAAAIAAINGVGK